MAGEELQNILAMLRKQPTITDWNWERMRVQNDRAIQIAPFPKGVEVESIDADGVPCEWIWAPNAQQDRVLLYLHGGGFVLGSVATHRGFVANIATASSFRCLSVDYRLAPEHPHPAAVEDAVAAYRWLLKHDYFPEQIAVGGDSAGGGLVAAMLVALRDSGDPLPFAGVMLSPWVDMERTGQSMATKADADPIMRPDYLEHSAEAYLGGLDPRTPLASPLYADLTGLSPLYIQVGEVEVLLDDSTRFAERAEAAGVDVVLDVWDDLFHVFQLFSPQLPEADQSIVKISAYLNSKLDSD